MKYKHLFMFFLLFTISIYPQEIIFNTKGEKINLSDFDISLVPIKTNNANVIGKINYVKYYNNLYYILDKLNMTIFIYSKNGNFISKINNRGEGPGKYSTITSFSINPDNQLIEILDGNTSVIYKYDVVGNYKGSIKMDFFSVSFEYLDNNNIVVNKQYQRGLKEYNYNLLICDNSFNVKSKYDKITNHPPDALSFSPVIPLKKINNQIFWIKTYTPVIYRIDDEKPTITEIPFHIKNWPDKKFAFNKNLTDLKYIYNKMTKNFVYFFDIFPFKNYTIAHYHYQKIPYISVYFNRNNTSVTYNCSNMPKGFNNFVGHTDDAVIISINPLDLLNGKFKLTSEQINMIKRYDNEPNPWLLLLKPKQK